MARAHTYTKLDRRLLRQVGRAVSDWNLLEEGDRVLVAMSGGKDSYALLAVLDMLRGRAPIDFELVPWHLDQGQPGYDGEPLRRWLEARGGEYHVIRRDTYQVVMDKVKPGDTYCSLCSRLRRGILYDEAQRLRCTKIALGHHGDDAIETLLLNLLFTGQLKAMPPWLRSDDGRNVVIRPLLQCLEEDTRALALERSFPILPCNLCGSQDNMQRQMVKAMVSDLATRYPRVRHSMLAALGRTRPTHLPDTALWRRLGIGPKDLQGASLDLDGDEDPPAAWGADPGSRLPIVD
jgi:tRNA 2-thiocytidine biosynthesis protein TtcA